MQVFNFDTVSSIKFGSGKLASIGNLAFITKFKRVLVVTDEGISSSGILDIALKSLKEEGLQIDVYKNVQADPTDAICIEATLLAKEKRSDIIIGLGGGSSLDVAKIVSVLAASDTSLSDIYGIDKITTDRLAMILVPTTAGTGSEVTPVSIITTSKNVKMGVVSPKILPDVALLDPSLTIGLPAHITAATGIDAMVHAIEAYASINPNNNPISQMMARQALRLLGSAIETAVHDGQNSFARRDMLLGSMLAGQAFANSPVAAVHALAYPLGGRYKIPHGLSNALVLPHVLRFNIETTPEPYAEIAADAFPELYDHSPLDKAEALPDHLSQLIEKCGLQSKLREMDIPRDAIETLASDAMNQTRLLINNPRDVGLADAIEIYEAAW